MFQAADNALSRLNIEVKTGLARKKYTKKAFIDGSIS